MGMTEAAGSAARPRLRLPRLYAIVDAAHFQTSAQRMAYAEELAAGGCTLLQYRNKSGSSREKLQEAAELKRILGPRVQLIMNDRPDLCLAAGCDGVHVGQDDVPAGLVRWLIGPELLLGVSTHNPAQVAEAAAGSADYVAIGPVFGTGSKERPDPVVGLEGVRRARALTGKPLVAIGGITRANARAVVEAGADAVAVIADLLAEPRRAAEEFFGLF